MKAPDLHYLCPSTLNEALSLLSDAEGDCQPLAGGQSLMPLMNLRMAQPSALLDLNNLSELDFIELRDGYLHIGAMVRYSALLENPVIRKNIPLFTLAIPHIAHSAIRNRGTIGGSVALADPAAEMPAVLKALDASIVLVSVQGRREIKADDFFLGVYETAMEQNELIHSIVIPVASPVQRFGFYELARRHGDYAMAGVALSAASVDPFSELRIVFFSVGEHAIRAPAAEAILNGSTRSDASVIKEACASLSELEFYADANASAAVKAHLAGVVMQRALHGINREGS